ncbi:hypothetical protein ACTGXQ_12745, partial [Streptococcus suis]
MLDTPPNRYHCISEPLSVCWGLFLLPEFQKNSVFSKFDRKILTFISDVFKNCRFCGHNKRPCPEVLILFKKQKLTYNRFMKLTIEQTKELKTYLKDKTYSPFHRRLQV